MTERDKEIARAASIAAPVYEAQGWVWGGHGVSEVPTEAEVTLALERLVERLEPESHWVLSGRLLVFRDEDGMGMALHLGRIQDETA